MEVKNSLTDKIKMSIGAIDSKELKLMDKFDAFKNFAEGALPNSSKEKVAWFVSNAISEVRNNKELMDAAKIVPNQFFGALMKSIQMGLPIGNQYRVASLIPRNDKNTVKSITLQLWTRAYKMLASRTEKYSEIQVRPVYEKDQLEVIFQDGRDSFTFKPLLWGDRGNKLGYIVYCRNLKTGNPVFRLYDMNFINKRKALAKTPLFWDKWSDEMEMKTIIGDFCKNWLDTEIEVQKYMNEEEKSYSLNVDVAEPVMEEVTTELPEIDVEIQEALKEARENIENKEKKSKKVKEAEKVEVVEDNDELESLFGGGTK